MLAVSENHSSAVSVDFQGNSEESFRSPCSHASYFPIILCKVASANLPVLSFLAMPHCYQGIHTYMERVIEIDIYIYTCYSFSPDALIAFERKPESSYFQAKVFGAKKGSKAHPLL